MDSASTNNGQPPSETNNGTAESMQKAATPTAPAQSISPHVAASALVNPVMEEQYALVMDPEMQEPVELPTNAEDNTLLVSVLERAFPLAHGLRYKNPATGAMRVLKVNEEGTRFYPPTAAGWGNIVLTIVPKPAPAPMVKTEPTGPKASAESKSKKDYSATANKRKPVGIVEAAAVKKRGRIAVQSGGGNSQGEVPASAKEDAERLSNSPPAGKKRKSESVAEDERDEHEEEEEEGDEDGSVHLIDDDDEVEELEEKEETAGTKEADSNESVAAKKNEEGGAKRPRGKRGNRTAAWKAKKEAEAAAAVASEKKCTDLIVLGLTHTTTEEEIRAYFEQFGSVVMCELKMGSKGGSRGFGFIHMAKYADQEKVLHHPNHTIGGKIVEVQKSTPKGDRDVSPSVRSKKLFIGRLPDWMKTDRMRDFFFEEAKKIDPMVKIMDVYIPKPFRNFGFVTFNSARVVRELSRQIDFVIDGSSVSVSIAEPKASLAAKKGRVDDAPYMRPRSPERYGYGTSRRSAYDDVPMRSSRFDRYVEPMLELPMRGGGGRYGPEWEAMAMEDRYYAAMDQRGGGAQRALHHQQRGSGPSGYASYQSALDVDEQRQVRQQMLAIQHQLQQQASGMARTGSPGAGYAGPERGGGGSNPPMAHQLSAAIGDPSLANMNPEVVNAALKAFWSVARSGAPSSGQSGPSGSNSGGGGGSGGGHYPSEENWER